MKLFGYYLFEDPPELKAYRADLARRAIEQNARDCEDGWIPNIDLGYFVGYGIDPIKLKFKEHEEFRKEGKCHIFNRKKYCYHMGKEMVTDL